MTASPDIRPVQPVWFHIKCPCGRDLRAKPEQAGSTITCWSCHAAVPVPVPVAPGGWVARLLKMAARQVLDAQVLTLLFIGAVLMTAAVSLTSLGLTPAHLGLPRVLNPGVWAAAAALGLVMAGYGELLRRGSQGDWTPRPKVAWPVLAWRSLLCLATGTALTLPLIIAVARHTQPKVTPIGLAIAGVVTLILPLVMLATYLPSGSIGARARVVGAMLRRHPWAALASLLVLPLTLVLIETALLGVTRATSTVGFLTIDLFPPRPSITLFAGRPFYMPTPKFETWVAIEDLGDPIVLGLYGESLRKGYTLIGGIPASLAMGKTNGYDLNAVGLGPWQYLAHRMAYTMLIVVAMLSALAVQARWLGLLSMVDARRISANGASRH